MLHKIKTREIVKDVKALDRAATASEHMRDAFVRTRDSAERTQAPEHDSPSGYAIEKIKGKAEDTAREAVYQAENLGGRAFHKARDMRRSHKEAKQAADNVRESVRSVKASAKGARGPARGTGEAAKGTHRTTHSMNNTSKNIRDTSRSTKTAADLPKELMKKRAQDAARRSGVRAQQFAGRTAGQSAHSVEKGVERTAKGTARAARKSIKTAENTAKTTVKTTQRTAQATRRTAQAAAKAAKQAAQAARAAAKATVKAVKITIKVLITTIKAIIAATKALVTAIAAGGWVAVAVILIICMVAMLICSVFGIFFSSEAGVSDNGLTMNAVVSQINTEFAGELARIQRENPHDRCVINANRALWKEILAVYAVKTNTDPDNPLDVITLDDEKIELLRTVFWDMNIIDYWIEEIEHTGEDEETWYEYILHITVTGKTAAEMAEQYGFDDEQKELLEELLRPE